MTGAASDLDNADDDDDAHLGTAASDLDNDAAAAAVVDAESDFDNVDGQEHLVDVARNFLMKR